MAGVSVDLRHDSPSGGFELVYHCADGPIVLAFPMQRALVGVDSKQGKKRLPSNAAQFGVIPVSLKGLKGFIGVVNLYKDGSLQVRCSTESLRIAKR